MAPDPGTGPVPAATAAGEDNPAVEPTAGATRGESSARHDAAPDQERAHQPQETVRSPQTGPGQDAKLARSNPPEPAAPDPGDRVLTVPNVISMIRLLLVPVVGVLILTGDYLAAVVVLAVAGISDWVDGEIARRFDQASRLGRFLDPTADRLFIAVTIIGLAVQDLVPWWLVAAIFLREVMVGACIPMLARRGYPGFPVHDIGKAGTFALMYAFPLLLLSKVDGISGGLVGDISWIIGWAAALWGVYLYWSAGIAYLAQFRAVLASGANASGTGLAGGNSSATNSP